MVCIKNKEENLPFQNASDFLLQCQYFFYTSIWNLTKFWPNPRITGQWRARALYVQRHINRVSVSCQSCSGTWEPSLLPWGSWSSPKVWAQGTAAPLTIGIGVAAPPSLQNHLCLNPSTLRCPQPLHKVQWQTPALALPQPHGCCREPRPATALLSGRVVT